MVQSQEQLVEGRTGTLPDGTRVIVRSGRVVPLDGAEAAGFTPLGDGWFRGPDGSTYQEGRGGAMVKRTSGNGSASGAPLVGADARARFMLGVDPLIAAQRNLSQMDAEGYNPSGLRNTAAAALEAIPFDGGYAARQAGGDDYNAYQQSVKTFEAAVLPIMSGAAVTPSEAQRQVRAMLPQPGDSVEVLRQKSLQREQMVNAIAEGIGRERPFSTADEVVGPIDPTTGLPTYPAITAMTEGYGEVPIGGPDMPGGSEASAIDILDPSVLPQDLPKLLSKGGWIRRGDEAPYYIEPGAVRYANEGQQVRPGLNVQEREQPISERTDPVSVGIRNIAAFGQGAAEQIPFMDEAGAYALSRLFGIDYDTARDVQRGQADIDRRERPLARNAGGVTGFVGSMAIPGMGAARAVRGGAAVANAGRGYQAGRAVANTLRAGAAGAATGAVYGAGQGETIDERLGNAREGAAIGAVAAPVAGAAVNALARPVGRIVERVTQGPNPLGSAVDRYARRFKPDVNALSGRVDELEALGIQPTMIDVVDDARRGTYRALATRDTPAREQAVRLAQDRRANLPSRVRNMADQEVSAESRPTLDVIDELSATRRTNAGEGMAGFGNQAVMLNENAVQAVRSDLVRSALRDAATRAQSSLDPVERAGANRLAQLADTALDNPAQAQLTVREAQDISAALNAAADGAFRSNTPANGPVLQALGRAIRQSARDSSEDYNRWLRQYADDSQLMEAATTGRNFVQASTDPVSGRSTDAFVRQAQQATPPELAVQQAAARQAMEAQGASPTGARGVLEGFASNEDQLRRAAALRLDAGRLRARSAAELRQVENAQNISPRVGSQTGTNMADQAMEAGGALREAATSNLPGLLGRAGRLIMSRGFNDKEAEALIQASIDPSRTREVIEMLSQRMTRQEARNLVRSVRYMAGQQSGNAAARNDQ